MKRDSLVLFVVVIVSTLTYNTNSQGINPTILQDTRDLPKTDGTFGFLYRTEDGIAHAAKGDQDGIIHGRFTYTDPTGLRVNYNYNAGSRVTPKYNYNDPPISQHRRPILPPSEPVERPIPQAAPRPISQRQPQYEPEQQYEPEPQYVPRTPQRRPRVNYRARRPINRNEVYDYDY